MSNQDYDTELRDMIRQRDVLQRGVDLMEQEVDRLEAQVKRDAETIRNLGAQIDQLQRRCQSWEDRALEAEARMPEGHYSIDKRFDCMDMDYGPCTGYYITELNLTFFRYEHDPSRVSFHEGDESVVPR